MRDIKNPSMPTEYLAQYSAGARRLRGWVCGDLINYRSTCRIGVSSFFGNGFRLILRAVAVVQYTSGIFPPDSDHTHPLARDFNDLCNLGSRLALTGQ